MKDVFSFVRMAVRNVMHRKARSLLTIIGITIGISSVVALITLGNSLSFAVEDQLEQLGTDKVFIAARGTGGANIGPPTGSVAVLTESDVGVIKRIKGVDIVIAALFANMPVKYKGETQIMSVSGVPAKDGQKFFTDVQGFEIDRGRFVKDGEENTVVIGAKVTDDVFKTDIRVGSGIEILGKKLKVVGILKSVGNSQDDRSITMSMEAMRDITGKKEEVTAILAKVFGDPKKVAEDIEKKLDDRKGEDLFTAQTSDQVIQQVNNVFGVMSVVLAGIAGISLIVAAFGIMNTMLMSVLERTREIGTMKATGAKDKHIIMLFLIESAIVGGFGGIAGVVVGLLLTGIIAGVAANLVGIAIQVQLDIILITFTILFASVVGVLAGTYPAYKAAKLNPVEALRYE